MKISRMTREQKDFFLDMDPLMMMDRLDFPNTFALIATLQNEEAGEDIPAGLMICSLQGRALIIEWLCVAAAFRMQGIGEQLLVSAFDMASEGKLENICAYINDEYGRELICAGQENYFRERLFDREQILPGEWITDLRTLVSRPFFQQNPPASSQAVSLRKMSTSMIRDGMSTLAKMRESAMLYAPNGNMDLFDADLSFFLMDGEKLCGGLLVQCVKRSLPDVHADIPVYWTENVLYPVLFGARSEAAASTLLLSSMKAATKKYALDTDVRVILKSSIYEKLCTYILPEKRTNNKLLIADVSEYKKSDPV